MPKVKPKAKPKAKSKVKAKPKVTAKSKTKAGPAPRSKSGGGSLVNSTVKSKVPHVRFGFITLFVAWFFALLPVPILSYVGFALFNSVASILALVCFFKSQITSGIWIMAGIVIGSPIMYIIGLFVMGGTAGAWFLNAFHMFK